MSGCLADSGSWAKAMPPSALIAVSPSVPSDAMPERITPMPWLPCPSASVRRKESMGMWEPPVRLRGTSFNTPSARTMSLEGGMT
jgi:hypothetical protein